MTVVATVFVSVFIFVPFAYVGATGVGDASSTPTTATSTGIRELKKTITAQKIRLTQLTNKLQTIPGIAHSLAKGSTGKDVQLLQNFLKLYGTFSTTTMATGYFGTKTVQAVKEFQQKELLEPVGIVGPKTRARILTLSNRELLQEKAHAASSSAETAPDITEVILSSDVGADGSGVDSTTVFASTTRNIYAILTLANAKQNTAIGLIRYYENVYVDSAVTHPSRTGLRYTHFQWSLKAGENRVPGQYTIVLYIDGKRSKTTTFTIN